jgi:hypothetical protein
MQQLSIEETKHDIEVTKAHLRDTAGELGDALSAKVSRAKQTVDPTHYAQQFPWAALGIALGAGLAIGLSGADEKAASAAVDGAKKAGESISDGASSAKDAIVARFQGSGDETEIAVAEPVSQEPGVRARIATAIDELLQDGLRDLMQTLQKK